VSAMPATGTRRRRAGSAGSLGLLTAAPPIPLGRVQVAPRRPPAHSAWERTSSAGPGCRPSLRRPHPTAPAGTGEDGCGGRPALGRPAATGSGRARGVDPRSGRRDGQGDARAAHQLGILEFWTRGSVAWLPAPLGTRSLRTHPFAPDARQRPGKTALRTAFSPRYLIRMRPEVQVLPGPLAALTSRNAGHLVRRMVGEACAGSRTLTWLPFLVMSDTSRATTVRGPRAGDHQALLSLVR
jgi:hypothetical protein